jgi:gliding motility-associated-like protein
MVSVSGCVTLDTFDVAFYDLPRIRLGRDSTLCTGDSVLLDAGPGFEAYAWSTAEYTPGIVLGSTAAAWVEVTDTNGCTSRSDTAAFTFLPSPSPPMVQLLDDGLQSTFSNAYAWYRDGVLLEGQTGRELPSPAPGLYAVVVTNAYGCSARSDAVEVGPPAVGDFVSEAISPNGDGINEFFLVEGAGRYPDLSLVVLDRHGYEVFRRKPYRNDWNGTGKAGNPLPAGDYFFLLDFGAARPAVQGNLLIGR